MCSEDGQAFSDASGIVDMMFGQAKVVHDAFARRSSIGKSIWADGNTGMHGFGYLANAVLSLRVQYPEVMMNYSQQFDNVLPLQEISRHWLVTVFC